MREKLPPDKTLEEMFGEGILNSSLRDLGYCMNQLLSRGIKVGAFFYAITGRSEHPIRDGIIIYTCGTILDRGYRGILYLREIYRQQQENQLRVDNSAKSQ